MVGVNRLLSMVLIALYCCAQTGAQTIRQISISGHKRTQRQTIERELLFAVGTRLDSVQLAETERNLRSLPFLGQVVIAVLPAGEYVDIDVRVQDLYARALSPLVSGSFDALNYGLTAVDYNLAGRGQRARLAVESRADRGPRGQLSLSDPRLWRAAHSAHIDIAIERDGHDLQWSFGRPFKTLSAPRTYGLSQWMRQTPSDYYRRGSAQHSYATTDRGMGLWYGISRGAHYKIRPLLEVRYADRTTQASLFPMPHLQRQRHLQGSLSLTLWKPRFQQAQYISNLGPIEDLQIGSWATLRAGYAHTLAGPDRPFTFYSAQLSPRWTYRQVAYVFATVLARWHYALGGIENAYLRADLRAYMRLGRAHSAAVRIRWDALHRPDPIAQLLLGLDTGLRAFSPHAFDGTRRSTFSAEVRPTFVRTPWYVLAGAAFFDVGTAWHSGSEPFRLHYSAGLGLRAGLPTLYGTPVWRLDLAHAIYQHSWRLSIGIGQYF